MEGCDSVIPLSKPFIEEDDIETVLTVLMSDRLSMGPYTEMFEKSISEYTELKYTVAVNSGTSALHLILRSLEPEDGDYVLVPSFTFIASVNVALFERLIPVFVDIDPETFNVSPEALEDTLIRISRGKLRVGDETVDFKKAKFFMGVDIFGQPMDWDEILKLTEEYGLKVIEDSCEALGAEYKGRKLGGFGVAGAFAFYPNKQITTGEGGVVVTNDERIYRLSRSMRNQGRGEDGKWLYHVRLGYNYRMDEMSSALGWSQMRKIDRILDMREEVARRYTDMLKNVEGVRPPVVKDYTTKMSWFVYVVLLDERIDRERVMEFMEENGVQVRNYFYPVHLQPFYMKMGHGEGELPTTEDVSRRTLALPFYTDMKEEEQRKVVDVLKEALNRFQRG